MRRPHARKCLGHAGTDVNRGHEFERRVLVGERRDLLNHPVFLDLEILLCEAGDELAVIVGNDGGDLDDVYVHRLRVFQVARRHHLHKPSAVAHERDDPDLMGANAFASIPFAFERRRRDRRAHLRAVGEEGHGRHVANGGRGLDDGEQTDRAGEIGGLGWRGDAQPRLLSRGGEGDDRCDSRYS